MAFASCIVYGFTGWIKEFLESNVLYAVLDGTVSIVNLVAINYDVVMLVLFFLAHAVFCEYNSCVTFCYIRTVVVLQIQACWNMSS